MSTIKRPIAIVGGGTGGTATANRIARELGGDKIVLIEPSEKHYYQPLWTLVGAGLVDFEESVKDQSQFIPLDAEWIQDRVTRFEPEANAVITQEGIRVEYDYLIVSPGMQLRWDHVPGLTEALQEEGVCSNYSASTVPLTRQCLEEFQGGTALFTMPSQPIKCAGAPQKIMWLAEEYFRQKGVRSKSQVVFASGGGAIFGVEKYRKALEKLVRDRDIQTQFQADLVSIDGKKKQATFKNLVSGEMTTHNYDMIHVTPFMSAPDFIHQSDLVDEAGWIDVDAYSLQHRRFPNIFALGDASSLPTSRTGAAIRKQVPVLFKNLMSLMQNRPLKARYDGYASCPLVTAHNRCILAEFNYEGPSETFPFDQAKERWSMYQLKRHILPVLYWEFMMKGYC